MIGGGAREEWRGEGLIEEKGCGGKEREREQVEGMGGERKEACVYTQQLLTTNSSNQRIARAI